MTKVFQNNDWPCVRAVEVHNTQTHVFVYMCVYVWYVIWFWNGLETLQNCKTSAVKPKGHMKVTREDWLSSDSEAEDPRRQGLKLYMELGRLLWSFNSPKILNKEVFEQVWGYLGTFFFFFLLK